MGGDCTSRRSGRYLRTVADVSVYSTAQGPADTARRAWVSCSRMPQHDHITHKPHPRYESHEDHSGRPNPRAISEVVNRAILIERSDEVDDERNVTVCALSSGTTLSQVSLLAVTIRIHIQQLLTQQSQTSLTITSDSLSGSVVLPGKSSELSVTTQMWPPRSQCK